MAASAMSTMPYNYGRSAAVDPTQDEQLRRDGAMASTPGAPSLTGPATYAPNDPKQARPATTPMPMPSSGSSGGSTAPAAPMTFAQMQAAGYARPPMPAPTGPAMTNATSAAPMAAPNTTGAGTGPGMAALPAGMPASFAPVYASMTPGLQAATTSTLPDQQTAAALEAKHASGQDLTPEEWAQLNAAVTNTNQAFAPIFASAKPGPATPPSGPASYLVNGQTYTDYNQALNAESGTPGGAPGSATAASGLGLSMGTSGTPSTGRGDGTDILGLLEGGANGQGAGSQVQNATQAAALNLLNSPSPYGQQQVKDAYNWLGGQIDDQYALQRQNLGDEMARRGLGASSINAGRLNDLNIGQRSAKEGLAENLAQNYAQTLGDYQRGAIDTGNTVGSTAQNNAQNWLAQLMGYGQQAFNNDITTQQVNQNADNGYQQFIQWLTGMGNGGSN